MNNRDNLSVWEGLKGSSLSAWYFKINLLEVVAAFLIFFGTVYIGDQANTILRGQTVETRRIALQEYEAAVIQSYITSLSGAGFTTEPERRMLRASLDLYGILVELDPKYRALESSMPAISVGRLNELVAANPEHRDELNQLFARLNGTSPGLQRPVRFDIESEGRYHIVIGTFGNRDDGIARAANFLERARVLLADSSLRPYLAIVREDNFVLATLSGFTTRDQAIAALDGERVRTQFPDAYASQSREWEVLCSRRFEPCSPLSSR